MTRIVTDTSRPRKPFVECSEPECETTHTVELLPLDWNPAAVYADLEAAGWSADPARCPAHRTDLYDVMSEEDRRAVVEYVIDQGRYLAGEADWSMEDNYTTTEGLAEVYHRHIAHDIQEG